MTLSSRIDNVPLPLGAGASMTFLHAHAANHGSFNENSLVVRLDLGATRIPLMGDAEAGGRRPTSVPPRPNSVEGVLLADCQQALAADILIASHHGSRTFSRKLFLDAVMASTYIISAGPTKYQTVVLPDADIVAELSSRGHVFRTDLNDASYGQELEKVGPDADGRPRGCDNVPIQLTPTGRPGCRLLAWPRTNAVADPPTPGKGCLRALTSIARARAAPRR